MVHTKVQVNLPFGFREKYFRRVFTIYGRVNQLGHLTRTTCTQRHFPN